MTDRQRESTGESPTDRAGKRSLRAATAANLAIAVAKLTVGVMTGSVSILAEAAHSVADTSKQGLLFLGRARANRGPDPTHPFGYGGERYFWGLLVAIVLFPVGAAYAAWEAVAEFRDPGPLDRPGWAVAVLAISLMLEGGSLLVAIRSARDAGHDQGWWRIVRRARDPDLPAVVLEDVSAVIGLVIAGAGVGLAWWSGDGRWDAAAALLIAVLLFVIAVILSLEMKSLVLGESALPEVHHHIEDIVARTPGVERLIYVRTLHLSPDELLVAAKVELDRPSPYEDTVETIDDIEARVYREEPSVAVMHVEPDIFDRHRRRPSWFGPHPEEDAGGSPTPSEPRRGAGGAG